MPLVGLKIMYMDVVGCPVPEVDFDGKILLRRVSEKARYEKMQHVETFADEVSINELIKKEWRDCVEERDTTREMCQSVDRNFELGDDVAEKLVIRYQNTTAGNNKTNSNSVTLGKEGRNMSETQLVTRCSCKMSCRTSASQCGRLMIGFLIIFCCTFDNGQCR
jgi:hypothetical protein